MFWLVFPIPSAKQIQNNSTSILISQQFIDQKLCRRLEQFTNQCFSNQHCVVYTFKTSNQHCTTILLLCNWMYKSLETFHNLFSVFWRGMKDTVSCYQSSFSSM